VAGIDIGWPPAWWAAQTTASRMLWRGVEAQHAVATMRLVDSLDEQAVLEQLLENSKPPLPRHAADLHFLLATPFRYRSRHPSRFRKAGDLGIWYGAEELHTACAEVAYWRWRFLTDSEGLRDGELLTEHTLFNAIANGRLLDLTAPPWSEARTQWADPSDYSACQALAEQARTHALQWLRYESARLPSGVCGAVIDPRCLSLSDLSTQQTWVCKVTRHKALMRHQDDAIGLDFADHAPTA
jgi:RES domain